MLAHNYYKLKLLWVADCIIKLTLRFPRYVNSTNALLETIIFTKQGFWQTIKLLVEDENGIKVTFKSTIGFTFNSNIFESQEPVAFKCIFSRDGIQDIKHIYVHFHSKSKLLY